MSSEAGLRNQGRKGFRQLKANVAESVKSNLKLFQESRKLYLFTQFAKLTEYVRSGKMNTTEDEWRAMLKAYVETGKLPGET